MTVKVFEAADPEIKSYTIRVKYGAASNARVYIDGPLEEVLAFAKELPGHIEVSDSLTGTVLFGRDARG